MVVLNDAHNWVVQCLQSDRGSSLVTKVPLKLYNNVHLFHLQSRCCGWQLCTHLWYQSHHRRGKRERERGRETHTYTLLPWFSVYRLHLSSNKVWVQTLLRWLRIYHCQVMVTVPLEQGDAGVWCVRRLSLTHWSVSELWALSRRVMADDCVQHVILQTMGNNTHTHTLKHTPIMFLTYINDLTEGVKQSHKSVCRWCELTKEDKKQLGLQQVAKKFKQDTWLWARLRK